MGARTCTSVADYVVFMGRVGRRGGSPLANQRLQKLLERPPSPQNSRLYGADAALQHLGDFFVAQALEVAEDYRAAKHLRNLLQRLLHSLLNFVRGKLIEGRRAQILNFNRAVPFFGLRIDGNILLQVALEPPLVVQRFSNGDAVQPRFQRTTLAKASDSTKRLQENFLGSVRRVRCVSQHAQDQVVDRAVIMRDQPIKRSL